MKGQDRRATSCAIQKVEQDQVFHCDPNTTPIRINEKSRL